MPYYLVFFLHLLLRLLFWEGYGTRSLRPQAGVVFRLLYIAL